MEPINSIQSANPNKLWTKDFLMGTLVNFFLLLNYYVVMVVITDYSMHTLNASPGVAGLSASIYIIGALVARLFCGRCLEQVGRRRMLLAGAVLELAMSLLYFLASSIAPLFLIRFFHGVSYGVTATAISTIVTSVIPRGRQGEGVGYYMLSVTLGAAIGPFLGMFLTQHGGFSTIFVVCAAAAALCLINALFLSVPEVETDHPTSGHPAAARRKGRLHWNDFFEFSAIPISVVCAIIYFGYSSLLSFLTSFAAEIHLATAASFFFVVYAAAILVSRPFTGRLFDSKGELVTMLPAFLSFLAGMALLSQTHSGVTLLTAAALIGFGLGVVQSCGLAIAIQVAPPKRLGLTNSTFYIFLDVGVGIGPLILGGFLPFLGYRGMYLSMAVLTAACALLYLLTLRGRRRPPIGRPASDAPSNSDFSD